MERTYAKTRDQEQQLSLIKERAFKRVHTVNAPMWKHRPRYKPENIRIVTEDDRVVATVSICDIPVRYGDVVLRMGGIGDVATDPDAQRKGYCSTCMNDAIDFMTRDGYDISLLFGINNFYHRFGYRTALVESVLLFEPSRVNVDMPTGYRVRKVRISDIPQMDTLYRRGIGTCDLAVQRAEIDWMYNLKRSGRAGDISVILDSDKRIVAYVMGRPERDCYEISEIGVTNSTDAYDAVLAVAVQRTQVAFQRSVEMWMPVEQPFGQYCLRRKCISVRSAARYRGGPMFRIINFEQLFSKISGTLSSRWADAPRSAPDHAVTVRCLLGQVALIPGKNDLQVRPGEAEGEIVEMPAESVTELVMGFQPAQAVLADEAVEASDSAQRVLSAVFPVLSPFVSKVDHF